VMYSDSSTTGTKSTYTGAVAWGANACIGFWLAFAVCKWSQ
jgi:hypothetical protein